MSLTQNPSENLYQLCGRLASILGNDRFPTEERAALRRMTPGQDLPLAFYRFALRNLPENWQRFPDDWATIVAGIAIMSPNAHNLEVGFGTALADTNYSETRLERLLAAKDETRRVLFLRAVRFLAAKAKAFNWVDGARFLLTKDDEKLEELKLSIARDFYSKTAKE